MQQLNQNYFQLFKLSESFDLDMDSLTEEYHALQTEVHPDKFVSAKEQDRLRAVQMTSYLNEAYSTLKSPLKRAAYILKLHEIDAESVAQKDLGLDLLMEQMQLRESLDELPKDVSALPQLERLKEGTRVKLLERQNSFAVDVEMGEFNNAKKIFHELQFLEKFLAEIEDCEEQRLGY